VADVPTVTVRYYAGAAAAAGVKEEQVDAPDLATLRDIIGRAHGDALARVVDVATIAIDGTTVERTPGPLMHGMLVEILPPYAGG